MAWTEGKTRFTVDVTIILIVAVMTVMLRGGVISVKTQGFYCNDLSISYPVLDETFKAKSITSINLLLPAIIVSVVEVLISTRALSVFMRRFATVYVAFFFGYVCVVVFAKSLKSITGELRPNFLDVCKPDFSKINCSEGYIAEYTCTNDVHPAVLKDAYKSFPSGHTCATFYMSTFLMLYLHKYLGARPTPLAASMFDIALAVFAIYCGFLRIAEHQHHWWDVICGAFLGVIIGVYAAFAFLFKSHALLSLEQQPPPPQRDTVNSNVHHPPQPLQLKNSTLCV